MSGLSSGRSGLSSPPGLSPTSGISFGSGLSPAPPPSGFQPSLKFNDTRNSQYIGQVI